MSAIPKPSERVAIQLASAVIHAEEFLDTGNVFDRYAFFGALADPELKEFLDALRKLSLLPVKR